LSAVVSSPAVRKPYGPSDHDASRAYTLRAKLRKVTEEERERRCGVCAIHESGPGLEARGRPGAWETRWIGVLTCGHIWTCPVCATKLRAERLARVYRAAEVGSSVWQMVTLTVRHRDGMPLRSLLSGLMAAWRRIKQGGAVQRIWTANVKASIRAVEVTRSANGWHPHLHVLLHTDGFTEEEQAILLERWKVCVERELGPDCVPNDERAIRWSTPIDMCRASKDARIAYPLKLGLEIAGPKGARGGSMTPWRLAELAAAGDSQARGWWLEFCRATKGRRMIELDDRAQRYAKTPRELADEPGFEAERERVVVPVDSLEMRALREYEQRFDHGILAAIVQDVSRAQRPAETVRAWIDLVTHVLGYSSRNGGKAQTEAESESSAYGYPEGRQRAGPWRGG
jgi:hypothetical protein